jgi:hypothetical protein
MAVPGNDQHELGGVAANVTPEQNMQCAVFAVVTSVTAQMLMVAARGQRRVSRPSRLLSTIGLRRWTAAITSGSCLGIGTMHSFGHQRLLTTSRVSLLDGIG